MMSAGPTVKEAAMFLEMLAKKDYAWFLNASDAPL